MEFFFRRVKLAVTIIMLGIAGGGQAMDISENGQHYDMKTIREVTSMYKLTQVCMSEMQSSNKVEIMVNNQVCGCVVYELGDLLSYREYKAVEVNILYERDWKSTDAMQKALPYLKKACDWEG